MIRKLLLPALAAGLLAGCMSYGYDYRGGGSDYYYGQPSSDYRYYGSGSGYGSGGPYGSIGYGYPGGWNGSIGYGSRYGHSRYGYYPGGFYGYPYGYYNGGYGYPYDHHHHRHTIVRPPSNVVLPPNHRPLSIPRRAQSGLNSEPARSSSQLDPPRMPSRRSEMIHQGRLEAVERNRSDGRTP